MLSTYLLCWVIFRRNHKRSGEHEKTTDEIR